MDFGGPRMSMIREAVSGICGIGCSIIVGCSFASSLVRVVLSDSRLYMQQCWPFLPPYVMVNDFTVSVLGSEKPVGEYLSRALPAPCKRLREMEVSVSRQKCQTVASSSKSAQ
eukprot:2987928-Pyramimonas_sp.AAC.1